MRVTTGALLPLACGALVALSVTVASGPAQPTGAPALTAAMTTEAGNQDLQVALAALHRAGHDGNGRRVSGWWWRGNWARSQAGAGSVPATQQSIATASATPAAQSSSSNSGTSSSNSGTTTSASATGRSTSADDSTDDSTSSATTTTDDTATSTGSTSSTDSTSTGTSTGVAAAAGTAVASSPLVNEATTADLKTYGAKCDGSSDDQPAFARAVSDMAAKHGVLTISGTCRIVRTDTSTTTPVTGAITIRGTSSNATLSLDTDRPGAYRELFKVSGDGVTLQNLTMKRVSNSYGVMISLNGPADFTLDGVVIDGQKNAFSSSDFHGLAIWGDSGALSNARILRSTIKNTDYGLFQDSGVTTTTDGFEVSGSAFSGNRLDDLEFNAPKGKMVNVKVTDSTFADNRSVGNGSGFGIGLANVQQATIQGNTFTGYKFEPVHIEDRSAFVTVDGNKFTNSFTAALNYASHVFVVSGSHDITVTGNVFDTAANTNRIDCVYAGPGGGAAVGTVTVTDNQFKLGATARAIGNYGATVKESGNTTAKVA